MAVTDEHGCFATSNPVTVTISAIAETQNLDFGIRIFPNPATENLNVVVDAGLIGREISVCDLSGRILWRERITTTNFKLEISQFSKGIYILKVGSVAKRITKQ